MRTEIEKIQEFVKVKMDGDFGKITTSAVAKSLGCEPTAKGIQRVVGVKEDGVIGPITMSAILNRFELKVSDIQNKLIPIARTQLFIRETSKNHGPGIEKFWDATNYKEGYNNREPYCASAMCWVVREADLFSEKDRPKTAAAFGFEGWAENLPKLVKLTRHPKSVKRGDLVVFAFSHIGLATSDSDKSGKFDSIEFNTNEAGSREGDGCYEKSRNVSSLRSAITIL